MYDPQSPSQSGYEICCSEQRFDERRRSPEGHGEKLPGLALLVFALIGSGQYRNSELSEQELLYNVEDLTPFLMVIPR